MVDLSVESVTVWIKTIATLTRATRDFVRTNSRTSNPVTSRTKVNLRFVYRIINLHLFT